MPTFLQSANSLANANLAANANDPDTFVYGSKANGNYIARVFQVQGGSSGAAGVLLAKGYLPESFSLGMSAEWGEPFANIGAGALGDAIQVLTNRKLVNQTMTMQVWQGTSPVRFNLRFHFVAYNNTYNDVVGPVQALYRLVTPSRGAGGILVPPGPDVQWLQGYAAQIESGGAAALAQLSSAVRGNTGSGQSGSNSTTGTAAKVVNTALGKITIYIGKFLTFDNVVVENVDAEFDTMFDASGLPISAKVDVSFKTFTILVQSQDPTSNTNNGQNAQDDDISTLFNQAPAGAPANQ